MSNEYIIINKTAIQKRIKELEQIEQELIKNGHKFAVTRGKIDELISLLFQSTKKAMDKQDTLQWHRSDVAHHPKYGLVEIFEVSLSLGFADVMPIDEKKWGTQWVLVKIEDLKKPKL